MNTFLNIGHISFLKEYEKCYQFSLSVNTKIKNSFYIQAVVFKKEWTPELKDKQKVFVKGSLNLNKWTDKEGKERESIQLIVDSIEVIKNDTQKKDINAKETTERKTENTYEQEEYDYIPF